MKRAITFILQVAIVIFVTMFLVNYKLPMTINVNDYVITTNTSYFLVFVFLYIGIFLVFYKILEMIFYSPKRIKQKLDYNNKLKGLEAIVNGLFFLSNYNVKQALKHAKIASKKIPKHAMTNFLAAKTYLLDGNFTKAEKEYRKIVKDPKNMSLGFNGLIEIATLKGSEEEIYSLSKQAYLVDPKNTFALLSLIDCQIEQNLKEEAKGNIKKAIKLKAIDPQDIKARLAEIAYVDSVALEEDGKIKEAIKELDKYYSLDLEYLNFYVRLLLANGQERKAKNVVKKAWKEKPHYEIALIWMELGPDDVVDKVSHAKELLKDWEESHITFEIIAKACVDAEIWGEARDYLNKAIETDEKIHHYLLMAKIEEHGFKDAKQQSFWLRKAEKEYF